MDPRVKRGDDNLKMAKARASVRERIGRISAISAAMSHASSHQAHAGRRWYERLSGWGYGLIGAGLIAATAVVLLAMGRVPICTCGEVKLWTGEVFSADNSQHISDWYTPSHVVHGVLFFGLLWLVARRLPRGLPVGLRALVAIAIEAGWEILENSPLIIDRYRAATAALGYTGDSVLNSVFDILFMLVGFFLAARLPVWASVALVVGLELFTAAMIRDNLTLNIIMLLWPLDAIRTWQLGA
jgi:hypothetical protein